MYDFGIVIAGIIVVVALTVGYISKKYLGDDNIVEEVAEKVIDSETGIDIDLSPSSPEKK